MNFWLAITALVTSVGTIIVCSGILDTISFDTVVSVFVASATSRGNRDFSYLNDTSLSTRYQNKTILFVFAGRQSRLEIQLLYLERLIEDGEIDFVHYHHCSPHPSDEAWLATLPDRYPEGWFELRDAGNETMRGGYNDYNFIFNFYKRPEYATSTFLKVDDDVVFLPLNGAVSRAIEYNRNHAEVAWTSGLVFNHPLFDHFMQQDGVLPGPNPTLNFSVIPGGDGIFGSPDKIHYQNLGKQAFRGLHEFVLQNYTHILNDLSGVYVVPPGWRVCINFMVFSYAQLREWEFKRKTMDEIDLKAYTYRTNKTVHVYKGAPAVHFSYGRQKRAHVVDENLLVPYRELACLLTGHKSNADDDHPLCVSNGRLLQ